ncbi:MAG: hypothetical protein ACOY7L_18375 [Pseudomonadota bacterium]
MSHPLSGVAEFAFRGVNYLLKLDNKALYYAEDILRGDSIIDRIEAMKAALEQGRRPQLQTIVAVAYGGLKENHPDIAEETVIDMFMSEDPMVQEAMLLAMRGVQTPDIAPPSGPKGQAGNARKGKKPSRGGTGS